MIYCRKCGAQLKDNAKFCDSCGCEVVKIKQISYADQYKAKKHANRSTTLQKSTQKKDEKNPYIAASMIAVMMALILAMFPWNLIGKGIGTSLPMRIAVIILALLGDYHITKAKQVNNLIFSKYGYRVKENIVSFINVIAVFVTIMGMFALFTY